MPRYWWAPYTTVLSLVVLLLALAGAGCDDSQFRKAARASDGIASGVAAMTDVGKNLHGAGLLTSEEALGVARLLQEANLANEQFQAKARTLEQVDPKNKKMLTLWFGEVSAALAKLNQEGVLHVKNEDARARLAVAFASIQASAEILAAVFEEGG